MLIQLKNYRKDFIQLNNYGVSDGSKGMSDRASLLL